MKQWSSEKKIIDYLANINIPQTPTNIYISNHIAQVHNSYPLKLQSQLNISCEFKSQSVMTDAYHNLEISIVSARTKSFWDLLWTLGFLTSKLYCYMIPL